MVVHTVSNISPRRKGARRTAAMQFAIRIASDHLRPDKIILEAATGRVEPHKGERDKFKSDDQGNHRPGAIGGLPKRRR